MSLIEWQPFLWKTIKVSRLKFIRGEFLSFVILTLESFVLDKMTIKALLETIKHGKFIGQGTLFLQFLAVASLIEWQLFVWEPVYKSWQTDPLYSHNLSPRCLTLITTTKWIRKERYEQTCTGGPHAIVP